MSSLNASSIGTLVNAITGGLTSGQTYDLMRRISEDLDFVFSSVNSGPLPAVDASALLHINPVNIDSPGDIPALITDPGKVAFTNWNNVFTASDQTIKSVNQPKLILDLVGGSQRIYLHQTGGGNFALSSSVFWNGATWQADGGGAGALFFSAGGAFQHWFWNGAALVLRHTITATGQHFLGALVNLTNLNADELAFPNTRSIRGLNAAANKNLSIAMINNTSLVELGGDADSTGQGHVAIPKKATGNLPAAAAGQDGTIAINTTTSQLCYWVNGSRFTIGGAAF